MQQKHLRCRKEKKKNAQIKCEQIAFLNDIIMGSGEMRKFRGTKTKTRARERERERKRERQEMMSKKKDREDEGFLFSSERSVKGDSL